MKNLSLKLLLEGEENIKVGEIKKTGKMSLDSADDQIDAYLLKLQMAAVDDIDDEMTEDDPIISDDELNESFMSMSLKTLLKEEGEFGIDDEEEDDIEDPGDMSGDEVAGSEDSEIEDPVDLERVKIDIDTFAKHVKEFVNTSQEKLDLNSVIVNRAKNLILDKHGKEAHDELVTVLAEYGLGEDPVYGDEPDENFQIGAAGGGGGV